MRLFILSINHILLEYPITTVINACNNVRDILYNADIISYIVKLIVHSPVGKLV